MKPILISESEFPYLHRAGQLAASTLDMITPFVKAGVNTEYLDTLCYDYILSQGGIPASLNYKGYPKSTCISPNHVICHGIPSSSVILKSGDIVNIDVAVILEGYYGDNSRMYTVGEVKPFAQQLIEVTYASLMRAIAVVKPGNRLGDIGHAIQSYAEPFGYSIVRELCGHGTGKAYHTFPDVLHFGKKGEGLVLEKGMVFTIEPMINTGKKDIKVLADGWTIITKDKSLSAQFEHMIGVTDAGCVIFTESPAGLHKPPYQLG